MLFAKRIAGRTGRRASPEWFVKLWNIAYFFWPRLVPVRVWTPDSQALFGADGRVQVTNSPKRPVLDDLAYSVSYGVVAVAALLGMWVRGFDMKRDAVLWCILITFVAIHAIYFPANSISRLHGVRAALLRGGRP